VAAGRIGPFPEWLASLFVWLAAVPGALGWSWWHVIWIAVLIGGVFLMAKPRRIRVGQGKDALALGIALMILAPLFIAAVLFGIGRMIAG
jgi:FtsH-binding integral membrane protein